MLYNRVNSIIDLDKTIVVLDFDRTMTTATSITSWGIFDACPFVCDEYRRDNKKLYEYYRKIEIDENIFKNEKQKFMNEWLQKQISLFSLYKFDKALFEKILSYAKKVKLRGGINYFFKFLYEKNIPVLIVSAGVKNVIKEVLIQNCCDYPNIKIISNEIIFKQNKWIFENDIIDSINKSDIKIIKHIDEDIRNNAIIIGDQINDILCLDGIEKKISIGFMNKETEENFEKYLEFFDILLPEVSDYYDVLSVLVQKRGELDNENKQYQKTKKWQI